VPHAEVLIVTQHDSPQMMREAVRAGARGYIVKSNAARDLLAAVEAVSEHRSFTFLNPGQPSCVCRSVLLHERRFVIVSRRMRS